MKAAFAVVVCALCAAPSALAQKSIEDGLRDCERLAAIKFKQENSAFKKFDIVRAFVEEDKFADKAARNLSRRIIAAKPFLSAGNTKVVRR